MACVFLLALFCTPLIFAESLENVISLEEGQIEYYIFLDKMYNNPDDYEWSKGVDSSGDSYVLASEKNDTFPTYIYFYNLSDDAIDEEYNYFLDYSMGLLRDSDNETTGSINEDYIFANVVNPDPTMYPYGTYIGNKYYFTNMQDIPYSKFNMIWVSGAFVMDL